MDEFRSYFDNAPSGLAILSVDGRILRANSAFLDLAGIMPASLAQHRFQQLLSPAGAIFYETQFVPLLMLRGNLKEVAIDIIGLSGKRFPVLVNAKLQRDGNGTPIEIFLAIFEATERRRYEQDLLGFLKSAEQMAEVAHRSSDAIIAVAPDGGVRTWNNGAAQMLGYVSSDAVGRPFFELLFPQPTPAEADAMISVLRQGHDVRRETICLRQDGRKIDVSMNLTPHLEPPGVLVAFSAIIRDVTQRKLSEKALIQSEKLASVGRLASSIAHEINNPLESVTNLLYLLGIQAPTPEMESLVESAQAELSRVSHVVTHTLRFHRQSGGRAQVAIEALFESVLTLYKGRLQHSGIATEIRRSDDEPLLCYEGELRQILTNLIANAFDSMRHGGRLLLRHRSTTDWTGQRGVRITVADTGAGMDTATQARIFEPFFTTKGIVGTGLGLWITKDLVEKNRGVIRVRSSNRGGKSGTVVTVFFPSQPLSR